MVKIKSIKFLSTLETEGEFQLISLWDVVFHTFLFNTACFVKCNWSFSSAYRKCAYCAQDTCSYSNSSRVVYYSKHSLSLFSAHCVCQAFALLWPSISVCIVAVLFVSRCLAAEPPRDVKNVAWSSSGQSSCPDLEPAVPAPASTTPGGGSVHRQQCKS